MRKQSADSLTRLLLHPQASEAVTATQLRETWLEAVLPLVTDREQSVQQMAGRLVNDVLLAKLGTDAEANETWTLLQMLECKQDVKRSVVRSLVAMQH